MYPFKYLQMSFFGGWRLVRHSISVGLKHVVGSIVATKQPSTNWMQSGLVLVPSTCGSGYLE